MAYAEKEQSLPCRPSAFEQHSRPYRQGIPKATNSQTATTYPRFGENILGFLSLVTPN
jgi:hypothetical protein